MSDRAHIRNGALIGTYNGERGTIPLEGGGSASPVVLGYVNGNDKVVPIVVQNVDNSTGPDTKTSRVTDVQADQVVITITKSDMTPAELAAEADNDVNQFSRQFVKFVRNHENRLRLVENAALGTNKQPVSLSQVINYLKGM